MSLTAIVNIASLVSSLAVLGSLVYLAAQIRQGARNQRSIMDHGRSVQVGEWLQFIAGSDIAPLVMRGHAGDPELSALEQQRYLWSMYPLFLHFEDAFYQHCAGTIGARQYASIRNHLVDQCKTPGFRAAWQQIRGRFPVEFAGFMDGAIQEAMASPK